MVLGKRLRAARTALRMTLGDVETATGGEFKTSVLGTYERGERGLSVQRLMRLAEIYRVDPATLLPSATVSHSTTGPSRSDVSPSPGLARDQRSDRYPPEAVL